MRPVRPEAIAVVAGAKVTDVPTHGYGAGPHVAGAVVE
jgi:hypothetical protein